MRLRALGLLVGVGVVLSEVTTDTGDKEVRRIQRELKKLEHAYVSIGIHEDAGEYASGVPIAQVALWNEFGTKHSPERSFFRSAIDGADGQINAWREEMIGKILDGETTVEKALETIGFRIQVLIQNKIMSNVPPENAESTAKMKERAGETAGTLRATELMLRSIGFKVTV